MAKGEAAPAASWMESARPHDRSRHMIGVVRAGAAAFEAGRRPAMCSSRSVYVLAALLLLPEAVLTMLAGAPLRHGLCSWDRSSLGHAPRSPPSSPFSSRASACASASRSGSRRNKWLRAVNRALPKEGWKGGRGSRALSPLVPFGLQNYLFGVTKVRRRDYLAAHARSRSFRAPSCTPSSAPRAARSWRAQPIEVDDCWPWVSWQRSFSASSSPDHEKAP
jgi:hypothetical protein